MRTLFSGISRGTEALVCAGKVPPSEHVRMRCPFQEGDFTFPVKYGYCSVGEVIGGGDEFLGQRVFCLFPHQDRYVVPAASVLPLPSGLPPERAILAANMETALNGLWDSGAAAGDRITIVGAGTVGLLVAWLASRLPGAEVAVIDTVPEREAVARSLRISCDRQTEADIVFHCSGTQAGLVEALSLAGEEGRVVEMSWHGSQEVALPLGEAFFSRRLTIKSSQVGRLPPARGPRWSHRRRLEKALELLRDDDLDELISGESGFEELPALLPALARGDRRALCHRVRFT